MKNQLILSIASVILMYSSTSFSAEKTIYNALILGNISVWEDIPLTPDSYSEWVNTGGLFDCSTWSPNPNTIDNGSSFTQNSNCSQNMTRTITYRQYDNFSETYRIDRIENETEPFPVTINQESTGTKATGTYRYVLVSQSLARRINGKYADYDANRASLVTYFNGTQYKYNYTYVKCYAPTVGGYWYHASIGGMKNESQDISRVDGYNVTHQCKFVSD